MKRYKRSAVDVDHGVVTLTDYATGDKECIPSWRVVRTVVRPDNSWEIHFDGLEAVVIETGGLEPIRESSCERFNKLVSESVR